ncbi:MAG: hypothetical protein HC841_02045 [Verrucomicrobiae bacterium]|nr:hypothetical protein [Verrucomicrobiae bacterium]
MPSKNALRHARSRACFERRKESGKGQFRRGQRLKTQIVVSRCYMVFTAAAEGEND